MTRFARLMFGEGHGDNGMWCVDLNEILVELGWDDDSPTRVIAWDEDGLLIDRERVSDPYTTLAIARLADIVRKEW